MFRGYSKITTDWLNGPQETEQMKQTLDGSSLEITTPQSVICFGAHYPIL